MSRSSGLTSGVTRETCHARVPLPVYSLCRARPDRDAGMTDHAFAPGTSAFDVRAQYFLTLRPNTRLTRGAQRRSIKNFIDHLEADAAVSLPVGDLFIATHANNFGWIQINADNIARTRQGTWYEAAEEVDASGGIEVHARLLTPVGGGPVERRTLRILGCNVGAAEPFVDKLSDALGPNVNIRAPRHLNVLVRRRHGVFEHLNYAFTVSMHDPVPTRDALVAAFRDSGKSFYDGSAVPEQLFETCIRRNLSRNFLVQQGQVSSYNAHGRPRLDRRIEKERRLKTGVRLKHSTDGLTDVVTYPLGRTPPPDHQTRLADLRQFFSQAPLFSTNHRFPLFRRFGFADLSAFMAGFRWRFVVERQRMTFTASRHVYRLSVPVVDTDTGRLFYNYHTDRGPSIERLPEDNPALFYTSGFGQ